MERKPLSQEQLVDIDKKYKTIIRNYESSRPHIRSFFGPMFDRSLEYDNEKLSLKQIAIAARRERKPGAEEEDLDDKALESIIYYMGSQGQIFNSEHYAEASCEYDDLFNGADVCLGLPNPPRRDIVLSIDACSATAPAAVEEKFQNSDRIATIPGCSYLKYYRHERRQAKIPFTPHYILGANPAEIQRAVANFDISNPASISSEVDEDLRRKFLIELAYQSNCHSIACENMLATGEQVPNRTDSLARVEEAMNSHKRVLRESLTALRQSFGVSQREELEKAISQFCLSSDDPTFKAIVAQSRIRFLKQREARQVRVAKHSAEITRKTQPNSNPAA